MKNKKVFLYLLVALMVSFIGTYAFNPSYAFEKNSTSAGNSVTDSTVTKTYTCPMHPEVISDKPGQCPKCGMDLILKEDAIKKDKKKDDSNGHKEHNGHKGHKGCMGH